MSPPANTTADVMASALANAGIHSLFAYPGDPIIDLMEFSRRRGIDVVLARREGTAAFMAEASAMASGSVGACLSTLGPGSTALVNGVAAATLDRVPVIAISGQIETARQGFFTHQVVNHESLFGPVTKWAGRVEANAAAVTMRRALRVATAERPGAVHLSCAADTFRQPALGDQVTTPPSGPAARGVQVFGGDRVGEPGRLLSAARKPMLLVGTGAVRCEATAAVLRLAETVGMPIVVSGMAKGVVPEDSDWFAGVLDMACNQSVWELLQSSDLILAAGFDPVELIKPWDVAAPVMHIGTIPNIDQVYASDVEVVGPVGTICDWLADDYAGQSRWTAAEVAAYRAQLREAYYAGRVPGRLNPTDVVDTVRAVASADTIATCDVGSHKLLVGQGWTTTSPRSMLMTNGLSAMGFGLPAAIAAKMTCPGRPVIAMIGDGGMAMTATELRLASARGLGLVVVVFVDGSLNRIELKQFVQGYPSTATRIEDTDLVRLAESMDCHGVRVESASELADALKGSEALSRPLVVEARIDPAQYESQF